MIWIVTLWLLPLLITVAVVLYEWKFTDLPYTKSTAIATIIGGAIPVFGLVIAAWWIFNFLTRSK
jgi:hypothetical protein